MNKYQAEKLINNISRAIDKSLRERGLKIRSYEPKYPPQLHRRCSECGIGSGQYYRKRSRTWRCMHCGAISKDNGRRRE